MAKNISALVAEISAVNVCQSACERILHILNNPRFSRTVGERRDLWATISHTANAQIDANQEPVDKPPRKPRKAKGITDQAANESALAHGVKLMVEGK